MAPDREKSCLLSVCAAHPPSNKTKLPAINSDKNATGIDILTTRKTGSPLFTTVAPIFSVSQLNRDYRFALFRKEFCDFPAASLGIYNADINT